jgi:hypothetical protein
MHSGGMEISGLHQHESRGGGSVPWFRARPRSVLGVAAVLFLAVFVLRLSVGGPVDAINMLYALPIALVALAFGRTAGVVAGLLGVALVGAWAMVDDVSLSVLGWASRILPMLLLGWLLGDASDRLALADARQRVLEAAAQRHRDATEVNDTLVQGMAAAKWALEAGRYESGLKTLEETLQVGHELVSKLMRDAEMGLDGYRPPARR